MVKHCSNCDNPIAEMINYRRAQSFGSRKPSDVHCVNCGHILEEPPLQEVKCPECHTPRRATEISSKEIIAGNQPKYLNNCAKCGYTFKVNLNKKL